MDRNIRFKRFKIQPMTLASEVIHRLTLDNTRLSGIQYPTHDTGIGVYPLVDFIYRGSTEFMIQLMTGFICSLTLDKSVLELIQRK